MIAESKLPAPAIPAVGVLPVQEPGQRPARALPYRLHVHETPTTGGGLSLAFVNEGEAGAVLTAYAPGKAGPWTYSLAAGTSLASSLPGLPIGGAYAVAVHGPNGFLRGFDGDFSGDGTPPTVAIDYVHGGDTILIRLANRGATPTTLSLRALAYGGAAKQVMLAPGAGRTLRYPVAAIDHWYDFAIEQPGSTWSRRFAGHVETGRPSRSDPAIGQTTLA